MMMWIMMYPMQMISIGVMEIIMLVTPDENQTCDAIINSQLLLMAVFGGSSVLIIAFFYWFLTRYVWTYNNLNRSYATAADELERYSRSTRVSMMAAIAGSFVTISIVFAIGIGVWMLAKGINCIDNEIYFWLTGFGVPATLFISIATLSTFFILLQEPIMQSFTIPRQRGVIEF